jgi:hypothetical protein
MRSDTRPKRLSDEDWHRGSASLGGHLAEEDGQQGAKAASLDALVFVCSLRLKSLSLAV